MKPSLTMQHHVERALAQEPGVNCANIGVVLNADRQITLTGTVHCDAARLAALEAARAVPGVGIVQDALVVHAMQLQPAKDANSPAVHPQAPISLDAAPGKADGRQSLISAF